MLLYGIKAITFFFDNFYTSINLVKELYNIGLPATGTVSENRKGFPIELKNGKEWAKGKERGAMRWAREPPVLALQWKDNKVVSVLSTIDSANESVQVTRKIRTDNKWSDVLVKQPKTIDRYNKFMIGVDRSDQLLSTNNVMRKCMRWWKALFFHLVDMAVVNSFILFRLHAQAHPEIEQVQRPASYTLVEFKEEIVRQICGFADFDLPPVSTRVPPADQYDSNHMPTFREDSKRFNCAVCYKNEKVERKVSSYCSAPQCTNRGSPVYLHVTANKNCFKEWHSREFHNIR